MQYTEKFLEFWNYYPRRKNDSKSKTFEKWNKLGLEDNFDEVMKAVKTYKHYKEVKQGYNKGILVWVNQRMWETINEEEGVPVTSRLTESDADDQEKKVIYNVINPLIDFYGEPDWYSNGKNADRIIMKWTGLLCKFSTTAMQKGIDTLLTDRPYQNFPALSDVYKHINKYAYVDSNRPENITQEAGDWYDYHFINIDESKNFGMNARYQALYECFDILTQQIDTSWFSFSKFVDECWRASIIQNNFDRIYQGYTDELLNSERYQVGRSWVKKLYIAAKKNKRFFNQVKDGITREVL